MTRNTAQTIAEIDTAKAELCIMLSKKGLSKVAPLIETFSKQVIDIVVKHDESEEGK